MRITDIIIKKRNGGVLSEAELRYAVSGYTEGSIPDYQMSALLMAIYFQGMNAEETAVLCDAMACSGDMLDLSVLGKLSADKHSTGGVGDKTTFIVAPLAACLGCKTAKMSGRGLGHTGGTIDKLESVPGFRVDLTPGEFLAQVQALGIAVTGATGDIAPADKQIYALRDVTGTVESIPLIASSIMSKKLAAGAHNIVLDVTVGSGAFMKTLQDAEALAHAMVDIGCAAGKNVTAVLTDMDQPLGRTIGNQLELEEAIAFLQGDDKGLDDLRNVSLTLAAHMVSGARGLSFEDAYAKAEEAWREGRAFETFLSFMEAQGGDRLWLCDPTKRHTAAYTISISAPADGYIAHMNAEEIGTAAMMLGAGRQKKEDPIDPLAGIRLHKKVGDAVRAGECLATLYASDEALFPDAAARFMSAVKLSDASVRELPTIIKTIYGDA